MIDSDESPGVLTLADMVIERNAALQRKPIVSEHPSGLYMEVYNEVERRLLEQAWMRMARALRWQTVRAQR